MIAVPLIGGGDAFRWWLSHYPVRAPASPCDPPHNKKLHAILRSTHTVLAYAFFITVPMHIAAAHFHALICRDGVFRAMATARIRTHVSIGGSCDVGGR
jgi:cytochrome b561